MVLNVCHFLEDVFSVLSSSSSFDLIKYLLCCVVLMLFVFSSQASC